MLKKERTEKERTKKRIRRASNPAASGKGKPQRVEWPDTEEAGLEGSKA